MHEPEYRILYPALARKIAWQCLKSLPRDLVEVWKNFREECAKAKAERERE